MQKHFLKNYAGILLSIFVIISSFAAIHFEGDDDYIDCGSDGSLDQLTNFTVSAWVKLDATTANYIIVDKRDVTNEILLSLYFRCGSPPFDLRMWVGFATNGLWEGDSAFVANVWYHVLITYDGSLAADVPAFYVNGSAELVTAAGAPAAGARDDDSTGVWCIGATPLWGVEDPMNGIITEVAVWDSILNAAQIDLLYNSQIKGMPLQIDTANLVGYWPLDLLPLQTSIAGDTFLDLSSNTNNGTGVDADGDSLIVGEKVLTYPPPIQ